MSISSRKSRTTLYCNVTNIIEISLHILATFQAWKPSYEDNSPCVSQLLLSPENIWCLVEISPAYRKGKKLLFLIPTFQFVHSPFWETRKQFTGGGKRLKRISDFLSNYIYIYICVKFLKFSNSENLKNWNPPPPELFKELMKGSLQYIYYFWRKVWKFSEMSQIRKRKSGQDTEGNNFF